MQSYTFASDDAMAAVLVAYSADGEVTRNGGYRVTLGQTDTDTLNAALSYYLRPRTDGRTVHATAAVAVHRAVMGSAAPYEACWSLAEFTAVTYALQELWENTPEGDSDGSVYDNAGSLLSGIAQTLGIEFV